MNACIQTLGLPKAVSHNGVRARLRSRAQSVLQKTLDIPTLHLHVSLFGLTFEVFCSPNLVFGCATAWMRTANFDLIAPNRVF